jgi:hypothetical protein
MRTAGITPVDVLQAAVTHYVPKERCRARWALWRRFRAGISGYHKVGGGIQRIQKALKIACEGGLLVGKSVLVGKPASVLFGMARIWAAAGILYAYWKDQRSLNLETE